MKYIIASDLHGSLTALNAFLERVEQEKPNKIIFLGDIYYHGPRNNLPDEYNPKMVCEKLNAIKEKLIVIKGNCDTEVDQMISEFDFLPSVCLVINGKTLFLTHGHIYNKDSLPKTNYDGIIYGHFHTGFIEKTGGMIFANAGSLSLPKAQTPKSYLVVDDYAVTLKNIDGTIIKTENY